MPRALALSKKQFPDQSPGFPFTEDFDLSAIRLPREIEQKAREEADDVSEEGLADLIVETGFESVIGETFCYTKLSTFQLWITCLLLDLKRSIN